jgi:hypothetical protein
VAHHSTRLPLTSYTTLQRINFGPKFWLCLLGYTSSLPRVYSRSEVIASSTLGTLQQCYHHHQRLHPSRIPLPRPLQTTPEGLVENYLYLITEKVSEHHFAQRGFSHPSPYKFHSPACSSQFVTSLPGWTDRDWSVKLSDLFNGRKESELMTDWEDMGLRLPPTRPGQGNVGRLFVSENVESDAKSVHRVLRIWR